MSDKNMPDVPEWAYKLSSAFENECFSVPYVEKSLERMVAKIQCLTLEDFQGDIELHEHYLKMREVMVALDEGKPLPGATITHIGDNDNDFFESKK